MEEKKDDLSSHLQWFRNRNRKNFLNSHELPTMNKQEGEEANSLQIVSSLSSSASTSWPKTTFSELDEKAQEMLKLIEEDGADSFAKRAEMYYKRRPQLIQIVHDFHRAHHSLAERYQVVINKKNYNSSNTTTSSSSSSEDADIKSNYPHSSNSSFYASDDVSTCSSEISNLDEDQQQQIQTVTASAAHDESINNDHEEEMLVRREEMERLVEENKKLKEQMIQKDEEKREAIRQLCFSLDLLREEHENLMAMIMRKTRQNNTTDNNQLDASDQLKMFMFWRRLCVNGL